MVYSIYLYFWCSQANTVTKMAEHQGPELVRLVSTPIQCFCLFQYVALFLQPTRNHSLWNFRILKDHISKGNKDAVRNIIQYLGKEFAGASSSQPRNGGLIGLAACAIALGRVRIRPLETVIDCRICLFLWTIIAGPLVPASDAELYSSVKWCRYCLLGSCIWMDVCPKGFHQGTASLHHHVHPFIRQWLFSEYFLIRTWLKEAPYKMWSSIFFDSNWGKLACTLNR